MRASLLLLLVATITGLPAAAQQVTVGAGYAFADYKEQAAFLHFTGSGPTATLALERGRFALRAEAAHLSFSPSGDDAGTLESFTADQIGARMEFKAIGLVAVEAGYFRRSIDPERAAQSYGAATLGVRAAYPLAPGASVALRTAYVAGSDFTGGGSAPFGIQLGLSAVYGPGSGRFRLTGDFDFQRIDRETDQDGGRVSVPIQSSLARFGVAVVF
jgi:hypothetical protein